MQVSQRRAQGVTVARVEVSTDEHRASKRMRQLRNEGQRCGVVLVDSFYSLPDQRSCSLHPRLPAFIEGRATITPLHALARA
jgi:hypothetical protein